METTELFERIKVQFQYFWFLTTLDHNRGKMAQNLVGRDNMSECECNKRVFQHCIAEHLKFSWGFVLSAILLRKSPDCGKGNHLVDAFSR